MKQLSISALDLIRNSFAYREAQGGGGGGEAALHLHMFILTGNVKICC